MEAYRNVTQDGQQDVDEEVRIASALKENTERGEENGEDDLDEVAVSGISTISQLKNKERMQQAPYEVQAIRPGPKHTLR